MRLTPEAAVQMKKVTVFDVLLTVAENLIFFLLGKWDITVLTGSVWGFAVCVAYFYMRCASVPKALRLNDADLARKYVAAGRMGRMLVIVAGGVVALKVSSINALAALLPVLLFNRVSIVLMNMKGED